MWVTVWNWGAPQICRKAPKKAPPNFFKKRQNLGQKRHKFDPPKQFLFHFYALIFSRHKKVWIFLEKIHKFFNLFNFNYIKKAPPEIFCATLSLESATPAQLRHNYSHWLVISLVTCLKFYNSQKFRLKLFYFNFLVCLYLCSDIQDWRVLDTFITSKKYPNDEGMDRLSN